MRRRRRLLVAVVLAAGSLSLPSCGDGEQGSPAPQPVTVAKGMFGVDGHVLRALAAEGQLGKLDAQLASIEDSGLEFIRANVDWVKLEPTPPRAGSASFDFSGLDQWVGALARHRLRWYAVGVGASTPAWAVSPTAAAAGCGGRAPPADPAQLARMMAAVANRYGSGGSFWREHPGLPRLPVSDFEIWNEENFGASWCPEPDPTSYAGLLTAAAKAVHAADPDANVVLGGLAPFHDAAAAAAGVAARTDVSSFLDAVAAAQPELPELVDAVGVHTYGDPDTILSDLAWYRSILDGLGMADTPISLNEVGWPTQGEGATSVAEPSRVDYIRKVTDEVARSDCGVTTFAPHTWVTEESDPSDPEDWFGIADPDTAKPYPSGRAYATAARDARDSERFSPGQVSQLCGSG